MGERHGQQVADLCLDPGAGGLAIDPSDFAKPAFDLDAFYYGKSVLVPLRNDVEFEGTLAPLEGRMGEPQRARTGQRDVPCSWERMPLHR